MEKYIAVTGSNGYVGSHICKQLKKEGYKVIGIDRSIIQNMNVTKYIDVIITGDFTDESCWTQISKHKPTAIIHCAANSLVGPSINNPAEYYYNNVVKTKHLLDYCKESGINNFVFSSSSSIYGNGHLPPIGESFEKRPLTSYGKSKWVAELMLQDYYIAYGLNSVSFRYFNACGADPEGELGQLKGATHLIAKIMENILTGTKFEMYGNDYNTPDGTCVRDYTHVEDIARAHILALDHMNIVNGAHNYNLGSGSGSSVLEIIDSVEKNLNVKVNYKIAERRQGDPNKVFADITKVSKELDWQPKHILDSIVTDAYNWYSSGVYTKSLVN